MPHNTLAFAPFTPDRGVANPSRTRAPRTLTVLGATGSVGTSTLDLVAQSPGAFEIVALTAHNNVEQLVAAAIRHRAKLAVIGDATHYAALQAGLAGTGIRAAAGDAALIEAALEPADCVLAAIMGIAGLAPTLAAVGQGRRVALANKECLVAAGDLFMAAVAASGAELLPVDSEHSAVHQALAGATPDMIERIVLTASGGPFRNWTQAQMADATPAMALKHPNWSMGQKICIDSATWMNKGLELIEAFHMFPVTAEQLAVVVHPQSIIHAMVEYCDGSVMAQLGAPDMRTPIAYALGWPERIQAPTARLDLIKLGQLTFEAPDEVRFPALALARAALVLGGAATTVLNGANELAVAAFLEGQIGFLDIARTVADSLERAQRNGVVSQPQSLADVLEIDRVARRLAQDVISRTRADANRA
jgi:1-deoxy-D-xylulose-5-phosphate reductoisomerase